MVRVQRIIHDNMRNVGRHELDRSIDASELSQASLEVVGSAERTFIECAHATGTSCILYLSAHRKRRSRPVERLLRTAVVSGGALLLVGCRVIRMGLETEANML